MASDLTKVCVDCGKCLTAPPVAPTKLCVDCGRCCTAFALALTNVCAEVSEEVPTLIVNVPSWRSIPFAEALMKVCVPV